MAQQTHGPGSLGISTTGRQPVHHQRWEALGEGKLLTEDADTGLGHIVSFSTYTYVYFSLVVLTGITLWAAFQDFGVFNLVIALGIATAKAGVVTLIFMHLNYESKIIWGIVVYPLFIFLLIIAGTLGDAAVKTPTRPMFERNNEQEEQRVIPETPKTSGAQSGHPAAVH